MLISRANFLVEDVLDEIPEELLILGSDLQLMDTLGQGAHIG